MAIRNRKRVVWVSTTFGAITFAWSVINTTISVANLPSDASDAWKAILSVPEVLPYGLVAACLASLLWALFWPDPEILEINAQNTIVNSTFHDESAAQHEPIVDQLIVAKAKSREAAIIQRLPSDTWMSLHLALRYLVYDSLWGARQASVSNEEEFNSLVGLELRERLARGEITARGKLGTSKESLARATEPISSEFWVNAFVQPHGEIVIADDDRCAAATTGGGGPSYRAIILNRRDVEATWPRHDGGAPTLISLFVEPLRAQIEAERRQKGEFDKAFNEYAADRIPYVRIREFAMARGINLDSHAPNTSNLAYALEGALKDAAANGALKVWGRPDFRPVRDNDPLLPIPAEHFRKYSFWHGALHHETPNDRTETTTLGIMVNPEVRSEGETYYDLHVDYEAARTLVRKFADERSAASSERPDNDV